jgi:hypothetical protein
MTTSNAHPRAMIGLAGALSLLLMFIAPAVAHASTARPIMGPSRVSAAQLVTWYESKRISGARPAVPVATLAALFIEEGRIEGVAGDLAFVQAMVETGWLRHSARVPPHFFNYAGIGAVDNGVGAARFPNARTGVRAQIQHLRAYADRSVTCANFARPTVTPRCHLVLPKGKAPTWQHMGAGNWASDPDYSKKILALHAELLAGAGQRPVK